MSETEVDPQAQLTALLEGLQIPNPGYWNNKSPEVFRSLGACIALKASGISADEINAPIRMALMHPELLL